MTMHDRPTDRQALATDLQGALQTRLLVPAHAEVNLADALRETLHRPGNLVRARLALETSLVFGLSHEQGEQIAVAVEYFHTASLLFDDLPSMDDAEHRRGGPCIHTLFGEGTAILSALALINRGYALLWQSMQIASLADRQNASAYLEHCLGLNGVLNAQSRDIHFTRSGPAPQSQRIALEKTASMIRLPLVFPALVAGAAPAERHLLDRLGTFWGLGYQALDDLKDLFEERQQTGKTPRRDEVLRRPNVALDLGIDAAVDRVRRLAVIAHQVILRLIALRPELRFLHDVRQRFEAETATVLSEVEGAACCSSS